MFYFNFHVCVCVCIWALTHECMCPEVVGSHWTWVLMTKLGSSARAVTCSSLLNSLSIFWDRVSYPTWSSLIHLGWLTNELQGSFCLWYSPLLASVPGFLCRFWGSELRSSCLCTCEAGILTEPFSHPLLRIFWDRISWWVWSLPSKYFTYQAIAPANRFCSFCSAKDGFMALHIACKGYTSGSPSELLAF